MRTRRNAVVLALAGCAALGIATASPDKDAPAPAAPPPAPPSTIELGWVAPERPLAVEWSAVGVPPVPDLAALAARGRTLFAERCAACHGATGRGDGVFAKELPRRPRDLVRGSIRTRHSKGTVGADELFRSITAGAPRYGMPSFAHLPPEERWALVAAIAALRGGAVSRAVAPLPLPGRPRALDAERGARVYRNYCAICHGEKGDGNGPQALALLDERGTIAPPAPFATGMDAFRGGSSEGDVVRTVLVGRPGTAMNPLPLDGDDAWAVAAHVAKLAREGPPARREEWTKFFAARRAAVPVPEGARLEAAEERWDPELSKKFETAKGAGCRSCHEGIAPIATGRMALAIASIAGGDADRECAVCHEGDPKASAKSDAHAGLVTNPGNLFATSLGVGCGKCHSDHGSLTSLFGVAFPEARGGSLLAVVSTRTDPTGASGSNHAYRIQRALMAQETGKVFLFTASAGIVSRTQARFTDFPVDDPDGPEPCAGSPLYRAFMKRAVEKGHVNRLPKGEPFPTFATGAALANGDRAAGAYLDTYRKDCGRCHLWGEGKSLDGERRSSGCSACHVLNDDEHLTESKDPTIPKDRPGHALRHEIVMAPPEQQCNHCHTRGAWTLHSEAHQKAGMGCGDCHTSIDVHGDGNLYPSIKHQLEVRCEDCHGTEERKPWELPLGNRTVAATAEPRGTHRAKTGKEHLLTDRGNVRANWLREGDAVVIESYESGRRHVVPALKLREGSSGGDAKREPKTETPREKAHAIAKHGNLACSACHGGDAPRCYLCHVSYRRNLEDQDFLFGTASNDPKTLRSPVAMTKGKAVWKVPEAMPWGDPEMRKDDQSRLRPQVRGCTVLFELVDDKGDAWPFLPKMNPGQPDYPPHLAPHLAHEKALEIRACDGCHKDAKDPKVIVLPGAKQE